MVRYEIDVNSEGDPVGCRLTQRTGHDVVDGLTCPLLLERARFTPAFDEERKPVDGTYQGYYRWKAEEPPISELNIVMRLVIGTDGMVKECMPMHSEGVGSGRRSLFRTDPCENSSLGGSNIPFRDENGVPVEKVVTYSTSIAIEDVE